MIRYGEYLTVCKKSCTQPAKYRFYIYIKIIINEIDLYKTCEDHLEYSRTCVEYILSTNVYHQLVSKCFCIYTHLLHVTAIYLGHLQGVPSMFDVYSLYE